MNVEVTGEVWKITGGVVYIRNATLVKIPGHGPLRVEEEEWNSGVHVTWRKPDGEKMGVRL
jgi:hypothetical protein